jgi:type VI secretion system protein ImpA
MLVAGLCERYWDGLYPLPDEDGTSAHRQPGLDGLAHRAAAARMPLTEGVDGYALRDIDVARMQGGEELAKLETAKPRSSAGFYEALMRDCEHCAGALERIEHSVDARSGGWAQLQRGQVGLQSLVLFVKPMAKEGGVAAGR